MNSSRLVDRLHLKTTTHFSVYDCEMTTTHTLVLSEKIQLFHGNGTKLSYHTFTDKYKISIGSVYIEHWDEWGQYILSNEHPHHTDTLQVQSL